MCPESSRGNTIGLTMPFFLHVNYYFTSFSLFSGLNLIFCKICNKQITRIHKSSTAA